MQENIPEEVCLKYLTFYAINPEVQLYKIP